MPPLPGIADHVLVAIVALALPLWGAWSDSEAAREALRTSARDRIIAYWRTNGLQWALALTTLGVWFWHERATGEIGLSAEPGWRLPAGMAVALLFIIALAAHQRRALRKPGAIQTTRQMLERMAPFLPRARNEYGHFAATAITAGICEELIYRGFLFWYLSTYFGTAWWSWVIILFAASAIFAAAHLYQGSVGVAHVFLMSLFLGGLYLLSGSLIPCMILHAAADLNGGLLAVRVYSAGDHTRPATGVEHEEVDARSMGGFNGS